MKFRYSILRHLPALTLLVLFSSGWLAVPLRLALPEPVECTKTCCLDSGECCCLFLAEDHHDEQAPPAFKRLRGECAQFSLATFSLKLPDFSLRTEPKKLPNDQAKRLPRFGFVAPEILSFLLACEKSPRAPPVHKA